MKDCIMTIEEVFAEFDKTAARWRKKRTVGDVRHDKKYQCICIKTPTGGEYDVELSRLKTPAEAFHWLCHLTEKNWITPQITYDLIKVIKRVTTVNEYCCPHQWEGKKR